MAITDFSGIQNGYLHHQKSFHPGHAYEYTGSFHSSPNTEISYKEAQYQQQLAQKVLLDVWRSNFNEGMKILRELVKSYKVVAIDTEFPGVVTRNSGPFESAAVQAYSNIKSNIDLLHPIQIGFSFLDEDGSVPESVSTVQFNFSWDMNTEKYAPDSIKLLQESGIDFERLQNDGIKVHEFAEAFTGSGLALNKDITWIGFHSAYDWAYLLKVCMDWTEMPERYEDYEELLSLYFPKIVDIKTLVHEEKSLPKVGLQELGTMLKVTRVGAQHQAGSDARLTGDAYFRFLEVYRCGKMEPKLVNCVYGLNYCPHPYLWTPVKSSDGSPQFCSSASSSGRSSPASSQGSSSSGSPPPFDQGDL